MKNIKKGNELRDLGINKSFTNANNQHKKWGSLAYSFLLKYIKENKKFMAEDVRLASYSEVPEPPSQRAWGHIFVTAKKNKMIKPVGFGFVKNPKAHRTPATLWEACS